MRLIIIYLFAQMYSRFARTASFLPNRLFAAKRNEVIKVITDIDDTIKSSGGVKLFGIALGGIDTQYKRGDFYPGVFQFTIELSRNSNTSAIPQKPAVLTARAREFKFALALRPSDKICAAYRNIGEKFGYCDWGIGDVYYGSVVEWLFQERKGIRKYQNFEKMIEKDDRSTKCNYIIVGDTGEKDEDAAERIITKYPDRVRAVFLHFVTEAKGLERLNLQSPSDRKFKGVPIYYFNTYVGAAAKAYRDNLISIEGLQRVISQARDDLTSIQTARSGSSTIRTLLRESAESPSTRAIELDRDIVLARKFSRTEVQRVTPVALFGRIQWSPTKNNLRS